MNRFLFGKRNQGNFAKQASKISNYGNVRQLKMLLAINYSQVKEARVRENRREYIFA